MIHHGGALVRGLATRVLNSSNSELMVVIDYVILHLLDFLVYILSLCTVRV